MNTRESILLVGLVLVSLGQLAVIALLVTPYTVLGQGRAAAAVVQPAPKAVPAIKRGN